MKYYFDTNIWVAAFLPKHPRHQSCKNLIIECAKGEITIVTSGHCLAEFYSVCTKLPIHLRLSSQMAFDIIEDSIVKKCQIIDLTYLEYLETLKDAAKRDMVSGAIFDGLHVKAALKAEVDRIYTYNLKDFRRFGIPEKVILCEPDKKY